jgi:hypothetical protein
VDRVRVTGGRLRVVTTIVVDRDLNCIAEARSVGFVGPADRDKYAVESLHIGYTICLNATESYTSLRESIDHIENVLESDSDSVIGVHRS